MAGQTDFNGEILHRMEPGTLGSQAKLIAKCPIEKKNTGPSVTPQTLRSWHNWGPVQLVGTVKNYSSHITLHIPTVSRTSMSSHMVIMVLRPPGGSITVFSTPFNKAVLLSYVLTLCTYNPMVQYIVLLWKYQQVPQLRITATTSGLRDLRPPGPLNTVIISLHCLVLFSQEEYKSNNLTQNNCLTLFPNHFIITWWGNTFVCSKIVDWVQHLTIYQMPIAPLI